MTAVVIVRTGVANLASVIAAFERLGARAEVTTDAERVATAERVMLPGVGAFGAGMAALSERTADGRDLATALRERIAADRATIAICLGLQLLCEDSEETAGVAGLGVVPAHVARFSIAAHHDLKVPQLGWNRVEAPAGARFLQSGHAYFANSYRVATPPEGWAAAIADHGGPFVAAIERGRVLACQFHPELSGPWGARLLGRWLEAA